MGGATECLFSQLHDHGLDGSWGRKARNSHFIRPNTANSKFCQGHSQFLTSAQLTSDIQVDKDLLVALSRAGVALVPALVLDFEPPQEQGGVAVRDLGVEQGRPSAEVFVLQSELVLVVVVAMDRDLLLVPVDHHGAGGPEAARQDAVVTDDTGDVGI